MIQRWQVGIIFINMQLSLGYIIYPDLIYKSTYSGHWEVVLCQSLFQLILILIYIKGLNYFPNKDVIDIYMKMGRWAAFLILIPFAIHLIVIVGLNLRIHTEVIRLVFLPRTPFWAILALLFYVSAYTAVKGLPTIFRSSNFIFFTAIPLVIFIIASSITNFDFHNASPIWQLSFKFIVKKPFLYSLGISPLLFLGLIASKSKINFSRISLAWAIVTIFFLSFVYIPLFIFGAETVHTFQFSFMDAINSVDIRWFALNRAAMFFCISFSAFTILYNSAILWMIGRIMWKMIDCHFIKTSYWITAFSLIAFIMALFLTNWAWVEKLLRWDTMINLYAMIIIPVSIFFYGVLTQRNVTEHD
ncbi:GerAB/ArcD/ProY family transporter [Scopulibacillus cellulosilyticus]|uniref:GerAB/ArcD/ProY family transporter n=1 Tax=Scopulibacillus cellulosilyticus TaxID=2665665 RepID=A0ABW2PVM3_9BACL